MQEKEQPVQYSFTPTPMIKPTTAAAAASCNNAVRHCSTVPTNRTATHTQAMPLARVAGSTIVGGPCTGFEDKAVGCLLGALAGDALGAAVEGWTAQRVQQQFPNGLSSFQDCRMGRGCYTDDGQMLLALAATLVNHHGVCRASNAATEMATAFDPARGYGGSAQQVLAKLQDQLKRGPLPPTLGNELLIQGGSYGNGGAMRVAPLGLVYRNAPVHILEAALLQSLIPTHHVHPWAIEGALTQALAVAHLSKQPSHSNTSPAPSAPDSSASAGPAPAPAPAPAPTSHSTAPSSAPAATAPAGALQLLHVLQEQLQTRSHVMHSRMCLIETALQELYTTQGGPKQQQQSWQDYFATPAWAFELSTAAAVAPGEGGEGFQIKGTDAVAAAIWAFVARWDGPPADAVIAAVHFGGDTDTIACMTGALTGALHGTIWLPDDWYTDVEQNAADCQCFDLSAVQAILQEGTADTAHKDRRAEPPQPAEAEQLGQAGSSDGVQLVCNNTRNMGREGAVVLGRLLAQLDCRGE